MKKFTKVLLLVAAQLGLAGAAQAASVYLSPNSTTAQLGDPVSFDVMLDFSGDATIGGGFQISYQNAFLGSASFSYSDSLPGAITATWNIGTAPALIEVGFDAGLNPSNFSGQLGTLSFTTLALGSTNIGLADLTNDLLCFYDGVNCIDVNYGGATVNVSAVPVPAAVWLMASGLGALGLGLRRRRA